MSNPNYPNLLKPLKVGNLVLKNRIFSAPTSLADVTDEPGFTTENLEYYKLRAEGGAAVVCIGEVIVDLQEGKSHHKQLATDQESAKYHFSRLCDAVHSGGAAISAELDHGGALCDEEFIGHMAAGPSSYVDPWGDQVREMTEEEIYTAAEKYGIAARKCKEFGFDMVTLHAGHGWLVHQFLSPLTNFRNDHWGGSPEKRLNFLLLVVDKIRENVGKGFPIEVRMSGSERTEGGYGLDYGIEIAKALDGKVDLIHVSAGTQQIFYSTVLMHPGPFQKDMENSNLAAEIKKHVKTPVVTVGAFDDPDQMEKFLTEGHADAIAMGRGLIADPFFPRKVMEDRTNEIMPCIRCANCLGGMIKNDCMRCTVNPIIGREKDFFHPYPQNKKGLKVLIAGGGPGGMEAARVAYEKGHEVILCEERAELGGALKYADNGAWFKQPIKRYRDFMRRTTMELPIDVRLNTRVDADLVKEIKPDVLISAVGAKPLILPIPGIDGDNVFIGADLMPDMPLGKNVVVIGGGQIGCEEGIYLASLGHEVIVLEMNDRLVADGHRYTDFTITHELEDKKVRTETGMRVTEIRKDSVLAKDKEGMEHIFPCDSVLLASGMVSRRDEIDDLYQYVEKFYCIGDARKPKNVEQATRDAYDAVINMGL